MADSFRSANLVWYGAESPRIPIEPTAEVTLENARILADLHLPDRERDPGPDGEERLQFQGDDILRRLSGRSADNDIPEDETTRTRRYRRWLDSAERWEHGFQVGGHVPGSGSGKEYARGWIGRTVLGRGGNGIVGLWEWVGLGEDEDAGKWAWEKATRYVAVKQMRVRGGRGLRDEGEHMTHFNETGTKHIPKMYRRVYREPGAGTQNMRIDSDRREVHRMFMEFCEYLDLDRRIVSQLRASTPTAIDFEEESSIWSLFLCLVKASLVMEGGKETPGAVPGTEWDVDRPKVHFDLKPQNVFIGPPDATEHRDNHIMKIGDFGLTIDAKHPQDQDPSYIQQYSGASTIFIFAPEQRRYALDPATRAKVANLQIIDRWYGSHTNVYQMGTVVWSMMMLCRTFAYDGVLFNPDSARFADKGYTIGRALIDGRDIGSDRPLYPVPYSNQLNELVLECLLQIPSERPTLERLLREVQQGYDASRQIAPVYEAPQPTADVPIPDHWLDSDPPDLWAPNPIPRNFMANMKPLPAVLNRQKVDAQRFVQICRARQFLNLPLAAEDLSRKRRYEEFLDEETNAALDASIWTAVIVHLPFQPRQQDPTLAFNLIMRPEHTVLDLKNHLSTLPQVSWDARDIQVVATFPQEYGGGDFEVSDQSLMGQDCGFDKRATRAATGGGSPMREGSLDVYLLQTARVPDPNDAFATAMRLASLAAGGL